MLTAEFTYPKYSMSSILFTVRNDGPSPAKNVRVEFDFDLPSGLIQEAIHDRYFERTIPVMNPRQSFSNVWFTYSEAKKGSAYDLPSLFTVTVSHGHKHWPRHHLSGSSRLRV